MDTETHTLHYEITVISKYRTTQSTFLGQYYKTKTKRSRVSFASTRLLQDQDHMEHCAFSFSLWNISTIADTYSITTETVARGHRSLYNTDFPSLWLLYGGKLERVKTPIWQFFIGSHKHKTLNRHKIVHWWINASTHCHLQLVLNPRHDHLWYKLRGHSLHSLTKDWQMASRAN